MKLLANFFYYLAPFHDSFRYRDNPSRFFFGKKLTFKQKNKINLTEKFHMRLLAIIFFALNYGLLVFKASEQKSSVVWEL